MDDIEALCQRVIVLNQGQVFLDGLLQQLRSKVTSERHLIIDLENEHDTISNSYVEKIRQEGHRVWLKFDPNVIR